MLRTPRLYHLVPVCLALLLSICARAQVELPLYPQRIPNAIPGPNREEKRPNAKVDTIVSNVSLPTITVFQPKENANQAAVIIFPGGGYQVLVTRREGKDVAKVFNQFGITAFVVKYRLPDDKTMKDKSIAPLQDAQQAIRFVRQNAQRWNVRPDRIGIMGFSAGGHLAATAGTHFTTSYADNKQAADLRPDFLILINPLIAFADSLTHKGAERILIGDSPTPLQRRFFSNHYHVSASTPPTILIHTNDDSVVSVNHSLEFYQALRRHKVPAEIHIYAKGEHGFLTAPPFDEWFGRCLYWMNENILTD